MATCLARASFVWLLLIAAEIVHGILRTWWLAPIVGDFRSRQMAVFSGSLLILSIVSLTVERLRVRSTGRLVSIGVLWVVLTVGFEIGVGRLVLHYPWSRLASDYDLARGGLLPIGLLVMALSPWLATHSRSATRRTEARQHE
jgi:hypothetical protein